MKLLGFSTGRGFGALEWFRSNVRFSGRLGVSVLMDGEKCQVKKCNGQSAHHAAVGRPADQTHPIRGFPIKWPQQKS